MHGGDDPIWELSQTRAEWSWENQDDMSFYTRVLGGRWTRENRGVTTDAVSGFGRSWTLEWCRAYDWPSSMRFGFNRYGQLAAKMLAREWCTRAEYLFNLWVEAGQSLEFSYERRHVEAYPPILEWVQFLLEQPLDGEVFDRGNELNRLSPRLV